MLAAYSHTCTCTCTCTLYCMFIFCAQLQKRGLETNIEKVTFEVNFVLQNVRLKALETLSMEDRTEVFSYI